jgi:TatA/E family protein of Tat protein translocase
VFGSIGPQEILIVLVIALVVLGPKKLPEMARSLGKGVKEFKEGINDDDTVDVAAEEEDEPVSSRVQELPPADLPPADLPPAQPQAQPVVAPEPAVVAAEPAVAPAASSEKPASDAS